MKGNPFYQNVLFNWTHYYYWAVLLRFCYSQIMCKWWHGVADSTHLVSQHSTCISLRCAAFLGGCGTWSMEDAPVNGRVGGSNLGCYMFRVKPPTAPRYTAATVWDRLNAENKSPTILIIKDAFFLSLLCSISTNNHVACSEIQYVKWCKVNWTKSFCFAHLSLLLPRLQLKDAVRLRREARGLITDSREGLFLIRLFGFRLSPKLDNFSVRHTESVTLFITHIVRCITYL